jgi:hypothetical protein
LQRRLAETIFSAETFTEGNKGNEESGELNNRQKMMKKTGSTGIVGWRATTGLLNF